MNKALKESWIFLDLDGTLIDTIPLLKMAFFNFIKNFGGKANERDFDELNGASIKEVTRYFKKKLKLPYSQFYLENCYKKEFNKIYEKITPRQDVRIALRMLNAMGWKLALVTSASRELASGFLKKNRLAHYFEFIVSGDDVSRGKPDSRIYELAKARAGDGYYVAIEDSKNGIKSAREAGCIVLNFCPGSKYFFGVSSFADLARRLYIVDGIPFLVGYDTRTKISFSPHNAVVFGKMRKKVDSFWSKETLKNPHLYDGRIFVMTGEKAPYNLTGAIMPFRYIYYQLCKIGRVNAIRGAVTGIVEWRKKILILRRSNSVTESRGVYEFAPSGCLELNFVNGKNKLNPRLQVVKELREELGVKRSAVIDIRNFYLIFDIKSRLFDVFYLIRLKKFAKPGLGTGGEHTEIRSLSFQSLKKEIKNNPEEFEPLVKLYFNLKKYKSFYGNQ